MSHSAGAKAGIQAQDSPTIASPQATLYAQTYSDSNRLHSSDRRYVTCCDRLVLRAFPGTNRLNLKQVQKCGPDPADDGDSERGKLQYSTPMAQGQGYNGHEHNSTDPSQEWNTYSEHCLNEFELTHSFAPTHPSINSIAHACTSQSLLFRFARRSSGT